MTYQDLFDKLARLPKDRLQQTATVCDADGEYFHIIGLYFAQEDNDVLDEGDPYLVVDNTYSL